VINYEIVDDFGGTAAKKVLWLNPDNGVIMAIRPLADSDVSTYDVSHLPNVSSCIHTLTHKK